MASTISPRGRSRKRSPSEPTSPRRSISPRNHSRPKSPFLSPTESRPRYEKQNGIEDRLPSNNSNMVFPRRGDRSHSRSLSPSAKSSKIIVEKLTKNVLESHIREIFGAYGTIIDLDLPLNRQCLLCLPIEQQELIGIVMTNRGSAYILFSDSAQAEASIAHMHEAQIDGATISVSIVLPRRKFSRSPPPARRVLPNREKNDGRGSYPGDSYDSQPSVNHLGPSSRRFRSSPLQRRASPQRRYSARSGLRERELDSYRPYSYSRSRSPRTRSRSFSSRSRSRSPLRRTRTYGSRDSLPRPRGERRRSPSYSSFSSYSERSRSRSHDRYRRM